MGATTNVTTVHYGTTWDENTLLEEIKQTNLELERKDGIKRHFRFPLFLTQYCLLPLHGGRIFFKAAESATSG